MIYMLFLFCYVKNGTVKGDAIVAGWVGFGANRRTFPATKFLSIDFLRKKKKKMKNLTSRIQPNFCLGGGGGGFPTAVRPSCTF